MRERERERKGSGSGRRKLKSSLLSGEFALPHTSHLVLRLGARLVCTGGRDLCVQGDVYRSRSHSHRIKNAGTEEYAEECQLCVRVID